MQRAKAFFLVSAGVFLLALAYHLGASRAGAQAGGAIAGMTAIDHHLVIVDANGNLHVREYEPQYSGGGMVPVGPVHDVGNFWSGATPAEPTSLGQVKARYHDHRDLAGQRARQSPRDGR